MKTLISILFLSFLFTACQESNSSSQEAGNSQDQSSETIKADFDNTYTGQINNKLDIVMRLKASSGQIRGTYYYASKGIDIELTGQIDDLGTITLNEFAANGNQTGVFKGEKLQDDRIEGKWSKPNGEGAQSFKLRLSDVDYNQTKGRNGKIDFDAISGEYSPIGDDENCVGWLEVKHLGNGKFYFEILVADNSHGCDYTESGTITLDQNGTGKHSSEVCDELNFRFMADKIIVEEGACIVCAMCSYSTEYRKSQ